MKLLYASGVAGRSPSGDQLQTGHGIAPPRAGAPESWISNVEVAVVIEVAKGAAPARVRCANPGSGVGEFFEPAVAQLAEDHSRRLEGLIR